MGGGDEVQKFMQGESERKKSCSTASNPEMGEKIFLQLF